MAEVYEIGVKFSADSSQLDRKIKEVSGLGKAFGTQISKSLEAAVFSGKKFSDVLRALGLQLSKLAFREAVKPLTSGLGNLLASIFSGFTGQGGAQLPNVKGFASGGVINSPVSFPLGRQIGLAGEAGPEAILPLKRGSDGRLGVQATVSRGVQITFNISTPDAQSFIRSQGQIATMLNRAVARGNRNL